MHHPDRFDGVAVINALRAAYERAEVAPPPAPAPKSAGGGAPLPATPRTAREFLRAISTTRVAPGVDQRDHEDRAFARFVGHLPSRYEARGVQFDLAILRARAARWRVEPAAPARWRGRGREEELPLLRHWTAPPCGARRAICDLIGRRNAVEQSIADLNGVENADDLRRVCAENPFLHHLVTGLPPVMTDAAARERAAEIAAFENERLDHLRADIRRAGY